MADTNFAIYNYHNEFYTGTKYQPDSIEVFMNGKSFQVYHLKPAANIMEYIPLVSFLGIIIIVNAVKRFFEEISKAHFQSGDPHLLECWNALKNFFRALIGFFPIVGNVSLIVYDVVKGVVIFESKILKSIKNEKNIAGVAIEGEVLFTITTDDLQAFYFDKINSDSGLISDSGIIEEDRLLLAFKELCSKFLEKASELGSKEPVSEHLLKIKKCMISEIHKEKFA